MHVLMIEDNEDDHILFKRMMAKVNDLVLAWRDRLELGIAYLQTNPVDVLLMDMTLPDGHGLVAFERVQSRFPALPVVILSGSGTEALALEAVRRGAQDYLVKGYVSAEMVEKSLRYALERQRAQNTLAEERNLLRTLVDALPDYIYIKDTDHRTVFSNVARARSFGLQTPEETIGKDDFAFVPADMASQFHADEDRLFETGEPLINREERSIGLEGSVIWASTTKIPLKNLSGDLIGLVGITRDVTERKEREQQLRYFASMQENVTDAVISTDLEFRIQSWNQAAERIYGWRSDEVFGKRTIEILRTDYASPAEREEVIQTFLQRGSWEGEYVQHRRDGSPLNVLVASNVFKDDQGEPVGFVSVIHDITERKKSEDALRQSLEKEKELGKLKSLLNSMASHEFRTPLTAILAKTYTLLEYRHKLDNNKIDRALHSIVKQVEHLTDLINDVLDLAQDGIISFKPADLDLDVICHEIVEEFRSRADVIHEIVYTCDHRPPVLKLDGRLLRQIFNNLISNALKYSPDGKSVFVTLDATDEAVLMHVRDQGIGIPAADQIHLFEPFHRAGNVAGIAGTGLGLTITRRAVEAHGGLITVDSQVGTGTTVSIRLPYVALNEKATEALAASPY